MGVILFGEIKVKQGSIHACLVNKHQLFLIILIKYHSFALKSKTQDKGIIWAWLGFFDVKGVG
jgi:hypothetical protein